MKYTALCALLASVCTYKPTDPTVPIGSGGLYSTGGSVSTGGSISTGGNDIIIADASVEDASVSVIEWPICPPAKKRIFQERKLGRRMGPRTDVFYPKARSTIPVISKLWAPNDNNEAPCLDQGDVGACTGFDTEHELSFQPFTRKASVKEAYWIYAKATEIDPFAGTWYVDGSGQDTGSDGFSAHTAAVQLKLIDTEISSLFNVNDIIVALQSRPGGIGANWSLEMFYPDANCTINYNRKNIKGGHQWMIAGARLETSEFIGLNSWGNSYGACIKKKCGYFYISFANVEMLLEDYGQADFFNP